MKHSAQHFTAPDGTEMVVLTAADFEELRSLAEEGEEIVEARLARDRIAGGEGAIPAEVLSAILDQDLHPVAAWRRYRGLSQAAVAKRSGLSQVWISRIERGGGHGSRMTRRRLAAALEAPVWALDEDFGD